MLKKSLLLGIVFVFCAGFLVAQTAEAPSVGDGSADNPYQIATLANLRWLSENTDMWSSGIYFIQTADIDASRTQSWNGGTGFSPIGNWFDYGDYNPFKGNYKGNGHAISGLYINRPSSNGQGLFGYTWSGAELRDIGLVDIDITGWEGVGGLIGRNYGNVSNCYASGSISGSSFVGGLTGRNYTTVSNCYASGSVSGTEDVGGLIGVNHGTALNCYASGSISGSSAVGGLIGYNFESTVSNCYASGSVSGSSLVGGLIGLNYRCALSNCYASGSISGSSSVGGFLGYYYSGTITACFWDQTVNSELSGAGYGYSGNQIIGNTTAEMKMKSTYANFGWDFLTIWGINDTINGGYPYLYWQSLPRIIINSIEEITSNSINIYADLFYLGFSYPYEHGFCWNVGGNPTLDDNKVELGPAHLMGVFSTDITGLASNTLYYIRAYATNEAGTAYSEVNYFTTIETGIAEGLPSNYVLSQNYPNPFNPLTTLQYGLPEASDVNLVIFDITGRKIKEWSIGNQQAGWHEVIWNGTDQSGSLVSTGVYIYSLRAGDFVDTKKMVFMK
ncbi:T9SS type A sorting domain-containing protein [bacterium]|nr:T9SS type A sorting domain-containing protein [bacterium]